jgi:hypothetical protein
LVFPAILLARTIKRRATKTKKPIEQYLRSNRGITRINHAKKAYIVPRESTSLAHSGPKETLF